jgi:hypothetical protein
MTARSSGARSTAVKIGDSAAVSSTSERVRPSPPPSASRTWRRVGSTPHWPPTFQSMSVEVMTTLASESATMWATSLSPSRKMTGTMTAPHLRIAP